MSKANRASGFEETAIAVLLGLMVVITFVNVVLRYMFNISLIWGLEVTLILFAWLVIFGISYGVKVTMHLGVDAITGAVSHGPRKAMALVAAVVSLAYAVLLLKGSWDYWAPFAGLWQTEGRWFPLGFDTTTRDRAFYITDQVPMPGFLRFLEDWINMGESYEKLPRVIPYAILPFGAALFLFRLVQATWRIVTGRQDTLIVSHEAEEEIEQIKARRA
ncbi:MAG: TRAP transporter small permease protein [Rhodobacterales bacterium CG2_30_65_12]|nr:MAG: TRAP transporter small permease protein [Rhodobacterales bacterium CG2_30_65_12]